MELINACMIFLGERLNNFKILVGNEFTSGHTVATDIASWSECANVSGKQLIQLFDFQFQKVRVC